VLIRRRVRVTGRVQGVWFRDSTRAMAAEHGLAGWVRNRSDGSVEAVFEGPKEAVLAAVAWCSIGPPRARVDGITVLDEEPDGVAGFVVR
jgi:acylphosphatase